LGKPSAEREAAAVGLILIFLKLPLNIFKIYLDMPKDI
jgi:hypothetical protein